MRRLFAAAVIAAIATPAIADTAAQAQRVITQSGGSCPAVTDLRGAAELESGRGFILAVACSDGSRHAVQVAGESHRMSYISTCDTLEAEAEARGDAFECFP